MQRLFGRRSGAAGGARRAARACPVGFACRRVDGLLVLGGRRRCLLQQAVNTYSCVTVQPGTWHLTSHVVMPAGNVLTGVAGKARSTILYADPSSAWSCCSGMIDVDPQHSLSTPNVAVRYLTLQAAHRAVIGIGGGVFSTLHVRIANTVCNGLSVYGPRVSVTPRPSSVTATVRAAPTRRPARRSTCTSWRATRSEDQSSRTARSPATAPPSTWTASTVEASPTARSPATTAGPLGRALQARAGRSTTTSFRHPFVRVARTHPGATTPTRTAAGSGPRRSPGSRSGSARLHGQRRAPGRSQHDLQDQCRPTTDPS